MQATTAERNGVRRLRIAVDFEGHSAAGLVVASRRNLYLVGDGDV